MNTVVIRYLILCLETRYMYFFIYMSMYVCAHACVWMHWFKYVRSECLLAVKIFVNI